MTHPITVLLAEDHFIVREGLRTLLAANRDFKVVGEAQDGRMAVSLANKLRPNVVVMDLAMPVLNGFEATRQILEANPETKVLVLSAHNDDAYIERVEAVGAAGYLIKQTSFRILVQAIREVARGGRVLDPSVARRLSGGNSKPTKGARQQVAQLSSRELEVLQLIAEGQMNKHIAEHLGISIKTVEKHRQNVMDKLHIHDTAGLTRYAIGAGIIESSVQLTIV